jgi:hypothetical protein
VYRGRIGDGPDLENSGFRGAVFDGVYGVRRGDSGAGFCVDGPGIFFVENFLKSFWKIFLAREKFLKKILWGHDEARWKCFESHLWKIFFQKRKNFS